MRAWAAASRCLARLRSCSSSSAVAPASGGGGSLNSLPEASTQVRHDPALRSGKPSPGTARGALLAHAVSSASNKAHAISRMFITSPECMKRCTDAFVLTRPSDPSPLRCVQQAEQSAASSAVPARASKRRWLLQRLQKLPRSRLHEVAFGRAGWPERGNVSAGTVQGGIHHPRIDQQGPHFIAQSDGMGAV